MAGLGPFLDSGACLVQPDAAQKMTLRASARTSCPQSSLLSHAPPNPNPAGGSGALRGSHKLPAGESKHVLEIDGDSSDSA